MLVTIITCFYNEEAFLSEAVSSVLEQEYLDWELILVDDGSIDKSTNMAKEFAKKHPQKIFYTDHPDHQNKGLSASRNLGISRSRGTMICFLDADDVYLPRKISRQMEILNQNPDADMVCEATSYWYSWKEKSLENPLVPIGAEPNRLYEPPALMLALYPLGEGQAPCTSSFMARKKIVVKVGGFEESFTGSRQLYEDQGFFSKMYLRSKVYISSECHSFYRQRQESLVYSIKRDGHYNEVRKFYLLWLQNFLQTNQIEFPELSRKLMEVISRENHSRQPQIIYLLKNIIRKIFALNK